MKWKKILALIVIFIAALLIMGITFTIGWRPFIGAASRPLTDRKFESTPQRFERGKYLVNGLLGPVKPAVDNTVAPTYCTVCGQTHGMGERN